MDTVAVVRHRETKDIFVESFFHYNSDENLGEEIGSLVADLRGQGANPQDFEIIIRFKEDWPEPLKEG